MGAPKEVTNLEGVYKSWPNGVRAAVSLSFDDNARSQLDYAIPILNRYGVRGTFYVNPRRGLLFERDIERWREASASGHELGNHTVQHPCSGNFPFVRAERALEFLACADIEADVLAAEEALHELVPGSAHSFAYPCGQTFVGRGSARQSYVPVIARHFTVARGVGESANDPRVCDPLCLSSWMVQGKSGDELIAMVAPVVEVGHWAVFCFHGIGGDHIRIDVGPFEDLVRYLAEQAPRIWTDTVQAVGEYVASRQVSSAG